MTPTWRQGRRVPRNVYRGDEPIAMVATADIAAEIVAAGNAREAVLGLHQWSEVAQFGSRWRVCVECSDLEGSVRVGWPCPTVRVAGGPGVAA